MKTITVTDEQYDFLVKLSGLLNTQDNRITADPIFCVYEKKVVYLPDGHGRETGWFSNEGRLQSDKDIDEIIDEYKQEHQECDLDDDEILEELEYRKFDYDIEDVPVSGQYYFSEQAAQNHIDCNHYHYNEPFVYAESAWRNIEWQIIREVILSLTKKGE